MKKNKIDIILNKLRRKIWISNIVKSLIDVLFIASIGFLCFIIIAHITPVVYVFNKGLILITYMIILGFIVGVLRRPSIVKTALVGDKLGLKQRLETYLEYKNCDVFICEIFKEETEDTLDNFNLLKKYKFNIQWKKVLISCVVCVLSVGIYFIPSLSMDKAIEKQDINKELKEEAKNISELKKNIGQDEEDENISENYKKEILLSLDNLEKKLNKSFDYNEGALQVSDMEKKLKKMNSKNTSEDMKCIAGIFDGLDNEENLQKEMFSYKNVNTYNKLNNEEFTDKEQERISENIKTMQKSSKNYNDKQKELLNKIKTTTEDKNLSGNKLQELIKKDNKKMEKFEKDAQTKLTSMKERLLAKGNEGFKSLGGEEKGADFAKGENDDHKNGEINNEKSDQMAIGDDGNQRIKSSSGVGGSGIGGDSEDDVAKEGKVDKNNKVTRLGEDGNNRSNVKGNWQNEGSITNKYSEDVILVNGEFKSMDSMYNIFKKEGMEYISKQEIPLEHRQLVIEYFDKLNRGQQNGGNGY
ncbi:spore cortex biosynthesis protein YabQ [Lutibacter sp. B2]|nr:spore cortex biosynthesis protein YabQ [Lutibacter sp. B2]